MPIEISWMRLLPGLLAMAAGVVAVAVWQRRARTSFGWILAGAATWTISVAMKFAFAIPMKSVVQPALPAPLYWVYVGLLTGVFEVGLTLLAVRFTRLRSAKRAEALAYGVGFGAVEALVLGVLCTVPVLLMLAAPHVVPAAARETLGRVFGGPVDLVSVIVPPLERASALVVHVVTCALVVHGFRVARPWRWFGVAFVYKSVVDAIAAWAILSFGVKTSSARLVAFEIGLALFAIVTGLLARRVLGGSPRPPSPSPPRLETNVAPAA